MKNYNFGHLLKVTRLRLGLEQREFARMLDISQSTYSRYEKGRVEPPLGIITRLVDDYDFPVYLLFYKETDDFVMNLPLRLMVFHFFENNYDFNPLRVKANGRKHADMVEILSEVFSLIGQVKQRYEMYKIDDFMSYLNRYGYDVDRITKAVKPIIKAFELDTNIIRDLLSSE
jgi:transcriptional regulator with XRE-family HTH domain